MQARSSAVIAAGAVFGLALAIAAGPASAQNKGGNAQAAAAAEQLFNQGRKLMKKGDYAAACEKFAASLEIDPAIGTRLNLASCYEKLGRLASAWAVYREAADLAQREGQGKRAQGARKAADKLEPRLPKLIITVRDADSGTSDISGLAVTRDGIAVEPALFGEPVYVDPGERAIRATAPGYLAVDKTADARVGEETTVDITLEKDPSAARGGGEGGEGGGGEGAGGTGGGEGAGGGGAGNAGNVDRGGSDPGRTRRLIGLTTGGVGVAVLATGIGFGISAITTYNGAFDDGLCDPDTLICTPEGQDQTDKSRSRATLSNLFIGAGVAAVAAGVVLYLTAPDRKSSGGTALIPAVGQDSLGVLVTGRF